MEMNVRTVCELNGRRRTLRLVIITNFFDPFFFPDDPSNSQSCCSTFSGDVCVCVVTRDPERELFE